MPAPKNNQNAARSEDERALSHLHIRVRREDKARWVKAARGTLSTWVVCALNEAARNQRPPHERA
jgi:hypothetical protein